MDIKQYLDSTYLKTAAQAGLTETENLEVVTTVVQEAIDQNFKLVMIRPEMVQIARQIVDAAGSKVAVGTVIDFPLGQGTPEAKLDEASRAIADGADELDFVVNYEAFKAGEADKVKQEVLEGTRLALQEGKIVKWIIEVAALNDNEIVRLSVLVKNIVLSNFNENQYGSVFVKSSTGFYNTEEGKPNGATLPAIRLMIENAFPLPVKAAGGVRSYEEACDMIALGVKRIGTSSAKAIASGEAARGSY